MDHSNIVASHYNKRPEIGAIKRKESPIIFLKKLNNYIKACLINQFTVRYAKVLDLACGKGGDLIKWKIAQISYLLGLDIAKVSLQQAAERYRTLNSSFRAEFDHLNCFSKEFQDYFSGKSDLFDLVSCQFAFHYCFYSEENVRLVMKIISQILCKGGFFIGTIPNAQLLIKHLDYIKELKFGNDVYSVEFIQRETRPEFGHEYRFYLMDAIDDCPEFLAYSQSFKRIAKEYGLDCVLYIGLHEYFKEKVATSFGNDLLHRMKIYENGTPFEEWEASGICLLIKRFVQRL
jgi:mRNA (guanine-N7-)-methyltransferase